MLSPDLCYQILHWFRKVAAALLLLVVLPIPAMAFERSPFPRIGIALSSDTRIGTNLPDLALGAHAGVVFVDAMKQAAPWHSSVPLQLDDDGNVTALAYGQLAESVIYANDPYPEGNYTLLYDGNGVFDIPRASGTIVTGAPGRIILHVIPNSGYGIHLLLRAVDPHDYPRNIRLILPGFEGTYAAQPFHPAFLQALYPYHVLRFKNWMHGDTLATSTVWPRRPTTYSFTQASPNGVALEYMIALANATGTNPWFTIPVGATDYYVENFARLVGSQLDPRLQPIFEYGSDVWKAGTPANGYALMASRNTHLPGAIEWYGLRSTQIFNLIARSMNTTVAHPVRVVSGPAPSTFQYALLARELLSYAGAGRFADAYAVTGQDAGQAAAALAQANHLQLFAFDDDEQPEQPRPGVFGAETLPMLRAIYSQKLEAWHQTGGALFVGGPVVGQRGIYAALGMTDYAVRHPMPHVLPRPFTFNPTAREGQGGRQLPTRLSHHPITFFSRSVVDNQKRATIIKSLSRIRRYVAGVAGVPLYINSGGAAAGNYVADTAFTGGNSYVVSTSIDTSHVTNPAPQAVYDSERFGASFSYTLTGLTANGSYTLRLHFAEIYWSSVGQRLFNVSVNGTQALQNFDIVQASGAANRAIAESFNVTADGNGKIAISFTAVRSTASIAGVELQAGSGSTTPLDINAGGGAAGSYAADTAFTGGNSYVVSTSIDTSHVTNPAPQAVYDSERFASSFSYTLTGLTANGSYTLRLHFAEIYYSSVGQRLFNVAVNGTQVLQNLDIVQASGAANRAIAESFNATADGSGKIVISFTAVRSTASLAGIELTPGTLPTPPPSADILTFHGDNMRTGWNSQEPTLNTTNVASSFGLLRTLQVDGDVLAQPLFVGNYNVPGNGTHNLLIVATEHDSVYAFDVDTLQQIWHVGLGTSQNWSDIRCHDIYPEYGITSTPVIVRTAPGAGTIYVVAATEPTPNNFHTQLHALDISTGSDQHSPVEISPSATLTNGSTISFDPKNQMSRTSLVWANNSLYVGIGSHCDFGHASITGWLLRYNSSLQVMSQFNTVDDSASYRLASIWMSGYASAVDTSGNLYFVTGNGAYDANTGGKNWGESVLKMSADLSTVKSYFTPQNWASLNDSDDDFGSGGAMLLPGSSDMVARGKDARIFLLSTNSLGGLQNNDAGALQVYKDTGGTWGGPAYFKGPNNTQYVYYQGDFKPLRAFVFDGSRLSLSSSAAELGGYGGSSPVVSSNGSQPGSGIVWVAQRGGEVTLDAYDATNVARLLFSGNAGSWSNSDGNPFVSPLVVHGRVFVGATNTVSVFGLH